MCKRCPSVLYLGRDDQPTDHLTNARVQLGGANSLVHSETVQDLSVGMDGVINAGHRNPMSTGSGITVESSIDPIRDALGIGSEVRVVRISTPTTPGTCVIASVAASHSKWCRTSSLSDPTIAHDDAQRTSRYEPIAVQRVDRNHDVLVKIVSTRTPTNRWLSTTVTLLTREASW
jgi:hypothetical protein